MGGKIAPSPQCVGGKFDAYVLLVSGWLSQHITKPTSERPERARWGSTGESSINYSWPRYGTMRLRTWVWPNSNLHWNTLDGA